MQWPKPWQGGRFFIATSFDEWHTYTGKGVFFEKSWSKNWLVFVEPVKRCEKQLGVWIRGFGVTESGWYGLEICVTKQSSVCVCVLLHDVLSQSFVPFSVSYLLWIGCLKLILPSSRDWISAGFFLSIHAPTTDLFNRTKNLAKNDRAPSSSMDFFWGDFTGALWISMLPSLDLWAMMFWIRIPMYLGLRYGWTGAR